jgi:hypothetical protein
MNARSCIRSSVDMFSAASLRTSVPWSEASQSIAGFFKALGEHASDRSEQLVFTPPVRAWAVRRHASSGDVT